MCHLGSAFCVRFDLSKKTGGATSKYSVQKKFEEDVKMSLNQEKNPFQLIYEGELFKQQ